MSKYYARKVTYKGITFDSRKEYRYYRRLELLEKAKEIKNIVLQPKFLLQDSFKAEINGKLKTHRKIHYIADFQYFDCKLNKTIVVDVKGMKTDVYKLKVKLLLSKYPDINFYEV